MNIYIEIFLWKYTFNYFEYICSNKIAAFLGNSMSILKEITFLKAFKKHFSKVYNFRFTLTIYESFYISTY